MYKETSPSDMEGNRTVINNSRQTRPEWLKVKAPGGESYTRIKSLLNNRSLHTVCEEAHCPNIGECWSLGTATFIILGDICSRNCRFCAVSAGIPQLPDSEEPNNIAESVREMHLKHVVITSVTRDDLRDGGSEIWANTIKEVRRLNPDVTIEVLIPDFKGDLTALNRVLQTKPDVLNHNIETVPRLYSRVRPKADYRTSLSILEEAKKQGFTTKSGLMVGIGETKEEIIDVMRDLRNSKVDLLTIGQYLQPTKEHLTVERFVHPDEFSDYSTIGKELGFIHVESSPLVRSSYHAGVHKQTL
ncbi:MAG: lipoyl synthase [Bacteroidota bacterium]